MAHAAAPWFCAGRLVVVGWLVLARSVAHAAAADGVDVRWDAPPGCPDASAVGELLERYAVDRGAASSVRADGSIRAGGDGYVLVLAIDDGQSLETRTLTSPDCETLARAAALVIAVAVDPTALATTTRWSARPERDRDRDGDRGPSDRGQRDRDRDDPQRDDFDGTRGEEGDRASTRARGGTIGAGRRSDAAAPPPIRLAIRPELLVGGLLLPGPFALGIAGRVSVLGRDAPWRVELGATHWFTRTARLAPPVDAGGRVSITAATMSGCGVPSVRRWEFPLCGGLDLGAARGEGFGQGLTSARTTDLWIGLHASAGLVWSPIDALALFGRAEVVASLRRPGFHLDGYGPDGQTLVHRVGVVGAYGAVGLEMRFF